MTRKTSIRGALSIMISNKVIICILVGVTAMGWFSGCKENIGSQGTIEDPAERQKMEDLTFEAVKELNEKSNLGEYELLGALPYPMEIPGGGSMNDNKDRFDCYPYAGKSYITRLFLSSGETDIFGIKNGQKEADADAVMDSEGYKKIPAEDAVNVFAINQTGVVYTKYDITIAFAISPSTGLIVEKNAIVKRPIDDFINY